MKKKTGFTLAEILVSLGIIGVIAAVTMPTLISNTQNAQIGPKLAKTVAVLEQGFASLLSANGVEKITDLGYGYGSSSNASSGVDRLMKELSDYVKISATGNLTKTVTGARTPCITEGGMISDVFRMSDGIDFYTFGLTKPSNTSLKPHKAFVGYIYIDINGQNSTPNAYAEDIFVFALYEDGSLRPVGGTNWKESSSSECNWTKYCKAKTTPDCPAACAGHIFENNFKKLYK